MNLKNYVLSDTDLSEWQREILYNLIITIMGKRISIRTLMTSMFKELLQLDSQITVELSGSNTDGSFTTAISNSFLNP